MVNIVFVESPSLSPRVLVADTMGSGQDVSFVYDGATTSLEVLLVLWIDGSDQNHPWPGLGIPPVHNPHGLVADLSLVGEVAGVLWLLVGPPAMGLCETMT